MSNAGIFLQQKIDETIGEYAVPALAAAVVGSAGKIVASAQGGIRKVGASGADNLVQAGDKFNLGSVSKVLTGYLMGKLIQEGVGGLTWETTITDVFPEMQALLGWKPAYAAAAIQQLVTHTAGMPYQPDKEKPAAIGEDWKSWTTADLTKAKLIARRKKYVEHAVVDEPLYELGAGCVYEGGPIICAAMAEKITGQTYEELVQRYIYTPLGMSHSGFGQTAVGDLDGPWQHSWT